MTGLYSNAIVALSLVLAVWSLVLALLNRPIQRLLLTVAAVLEVMLIGYLVGGIVQMVNSDHSFARLEFLGYLLGIVAIPPIGISWAWDEKSRSGPVVAAVVFIVIPIMIVRSQQVFSGVGI